VKHAFIQDRIADVGNPDHLGTFYQMLEVSRSRYYGGVVRGTQPDPDTVTLEVAARAAHARARESYTPKRSRTEMSEMVFPLIERLLMQLGLRNS
jgi:hypothetical protein